ncbi:MAG TPA: SAM-dependent methyltransferase [Clostridium sp.]|nr:SAM-dependent methyltransferase [Clostridium sp.]
MEYMGNLEYWDEKFKNRSNKPLNPEKSLVENIKYFKNGSVLDIACGDGRNTLFLLENGFNVTGVDFSSKALSRLKTFANLKGYLVNTKQVDLSKPDSLNNIGIFDNILINHYRLNKEQLENIENHITDNGTLFICGFGHNHKTDSKIRKDDLIYSRDLEYIHKSFNLIKYVETQDNRGFFVTYIFSKKN